MELTASPILYKGLSWKYLFFVSEYSTTILFASMSHLQLALTLFKENYRTLWFQSRSLHCKWNLGQLLNIFWIANNGGGSLFMVVKAAKLIRGFLPPYVIITLSCCSWKSIPRMMSMHKPHLEHETSPSRMCHQQASEIQCNSLLIGLTDLLMPSRWCYVME